MSLSNRPSRNRKLKNEVGIVVFLMVILGLVSYVTDKLPATSSESDPKEAVSAGAANEAGGKAAGAAALSEGDRHVHTVLRDILATGNDNDPRLDREFSGMSEPLKAAIRAEYRVTPREKLRERGTMVYALGRSVTGEEDFAFLGQVLREEPCLSVADCGRPPARGESGDSAVDETTVVYPQLMALRSLKNAYESISSDVSPALVRIRRELRLTQASSAPDRVKQAATDQLAAWEKRDRSVRPR